MPIDCYPTVDFSSFSVGRQTQVPKLNTVVRNDNWKQQKAHLSQRKTFQTKNKTEENFRKT